MPEMWGKDEGYFVHRKRYGDRKDPAALRTVAGAANPAAARRVLGFRVPKVDCAPKIEIIS